MPSLSTIIEVTELKTYLNDRWVHDGLNLTVKKGEIVAIIGPSGCGKTTLIRSLLMLKKPTSGMIKVFDTDIVHCSVADALKIQRRWGVMFQGGALFSSLNVLDNVTFPLRE